MISLLMMTTFPDFPNLEPAEKLTLSNPENLDIPVHINLLNALLHSIEQYEKIQFSRVELVYLDEEGIAEINKKFLDKDYITDTISFRYDEEDDQAIEGTLYECAPRIRDQSDEFGTCVTTEFYRVFVHGLLHLAGYNDQTNSKKIAMTELENKYLTLHNIQL